MKFLAGLWAIVEAIKRYFYEKRVAAAVKEVEQAETEDEDVEALEDLQKASYQEKQANDGGDQAQPPGPAPAPDPSIPVSGARPTQ